MNKKLSKTMIRIMGLFCVLVVVGMMTGCSVQNWTETDYFAPNWTPSGKIICSKAERKYHKDAITFGDQSAQLDEGHSYIVEMNADGSGEYTLFETDGTPTLIQKSTSENYVAYIYKDGHVLNVRTSSGPVVSNIDVGDTIYSFDWSPDESKLAINRTASLPIRVYDRNGDLHKEISAGGQCSWKYNNKLVFKTDAYSPRKLAFRDIGQLGDVVIDITSFSNPQYLLNGNKVYLFRDQDIVLYDVNSGVSSNINISTQGYRAPFTSPDGSKIVAEQLDAVRGFWLIDVSSNVRTQLR